MYCPNCSNEISKEYSFCPSCGRELPPIDPKKALILLLRECIEPDNMETNPILQSYIIPEVVKLIERLIKLLEVGIVPLFV